MVNSHQPVILIPYDFTEVSRQALSHTISLARMFGYSIKFLNILDPGTKRYMKANNISRKGLDDEMQKLCEEVRSGSQVESDYLIQSSSIKGIKKIAGKLNVMFMVLGIDEPRHGASAIMKVVSKSPVPVFVIQQNSAICSCQKILFPLDDFHGSRQKTGWAARIAAKCNASISIFSMNQKDPTKVYKHHKIIEQVQDFFDKKGIRHETKIAEGPMKAFPLEALRYGLEQKCDLFIIMYRPQKLFRSMDPIDRQFIFNESKIPVLCVNLRDVGVAQGFN